MPKPNCSDCKDTGLVVAAAGNKWCDCPAGAEYTDEMDRVRATLNKAVVPPAPPETLH